MLCIPEGYKKTEWTLKYQTKANLYLILQSMRSLFEYLDYRKYLADYYASKKKANRTFSYRVFNAKAGIASPVFFKLVIDGKRNLGLSSIDKFTNALGFNKKEGLYFKKLVLFDQTDSPEEKQELYNVLRSMRETVSQKTLSTTQYDYFSNWYNAVIRELITLYNYKDDFHLLANSVRPEITSNEAKASVELLLKLKLIKKDSIGTYEQVNTAIVAEGDIGLIAIRHFNRCMLLNALKAIDDIEVENRHISGLTMGISKQMHSIIRDEIDSFKEHIVKLVNNDRNSISVYQLNVQFFPLSRNKEEIKPSDKVSK